MGILSGGVLDVLERDLFQRPSELLTSRFRRLFESHHYTAKRRTRDTRDILAGGEPPLFERREQTMCTHVLLHCLLTPLCKHLSLPPASCRASIGGSLDTMSSHLLSCGCPRSWIDSTGTTRRYWGRKRGRRGTRTPGLAILPRPSVQEAGYLPARALDPFECWPGWAHRRHRE